ncbi:MAG: hypothetical protein Q4D98_04655 [Planctomycetia bacterium]|nr:hypothetical protein [Planctomycetia bacterium]
MSEENIAKTLARLEQKLDRLTEKQALTDTYLFWSHCVEWEYSLTTKAFSMAKIWQCFTPLPAPRTWNEFQSLISEPLVRQGAENFLALASPGELMDWHLHIGVQEVTLWILRTTEGIHGVVRFPDRLAMEG